MVISTEWSGYWSLTFNLEFYYIPEVSCDRLFKPPFGMSLNMASLYVIFVFICLSIWLLLQWTWNYNFMIPPQNNIRSSKGKVFFIIIKVLYVLFLDEQYHVFHYSQVNCNELFLAISLVLPWNSSTQYLIYRNCFLILKTNNLLSLYISFKYLYIILELIYFHFKYITRDPYEHHMPIVKNRQTKVQWLSCPWYVCRVI